MVKCSLFSPDDSTFPIFEIHLKAITKKDIAEYNELFKIPKPQKTLRSKVLKSRIEISYRYFRNLFPQIIDLMQKKYPTQFPFMDMIGDPRFSGSSDDKIEKLFTGQKIRVQMQEKAHPGEGKYILAMVVSKVEDNKLLLAALYKFKGVENRKRQK